MRGQRRRCRGTSHKPFRCDAYCMLFAGPAVQKLYIAIVEESTRLEDSGFVGPTVGQMQGAPTAKSGDPDDAEPSLTHYTTLARCPQHFALLALQPITGAPLLQLSWICCSSSACSA